MFLDQNQAASASRSFTAAEFHSRRGDFIRNNNVLTVELPFVSSHQMSSNVCQMEAQPTGRSPVTWCVCAGVPVSSRVSAKIQQLVNTLKRPKRPPLREFFVDDFEELLEGKQSPTGTAHNQNLMSVPVRVKQL